MSKRTPEDIIRSNECNTYVMACHLNRDELYNAMREDISTMCYTYSELQAQRDELLAALQMALADHMTEVYLHPLRDGTVEAIRCAIADAENDR